MDDTERIKRIELLESRRAAVAQSMWQVPALVFAGQAFLLQILTRNDIGDLEAIFVAAAGILASLATVISLHQQRDRELLHSLEIYRLATDLKWEDFRRAGLERLHPLQAGDERMKLRRFLPEPVISSWPGYGIWSVAVLAFMAADIVALLKAIG